MNTFNASGTGIIQNQSSKNLLVDEEDSNDLQQACNTCLIAPGDTQRNSHKFYDQRKGVNVYKICPSNKIYIQGQKVDQNGLLKPEDNNDYKQGETEKDTKKHMRNMRLLYKEHMKKEIRKLKQKLGDGPKLNTDRVKILSFHEFTENFK